MLPNSGAGPISQMILNTAAAHLNSQPEATMLKERLQRPLSIFRCTLLYIIVAPGIPLPSNLPDLKSICKTILKLFETEIISAQTDEKVINSGVRDLKCDSGKDMPGLFMRLTEGEAAVTVYGDGLL